MDNLFQMWWPVACVVLADVIYQVCAKKISSRADPLAALGVTYLVSAAVCIGLYYGTGGMDLLADMSHVRLAAAGIGFAVTGLEVGCVYMYKAGWAMNVGFILYTAMIVAALLVVGAVFYGEAVSFTAIAGLIITSSALVVTYLVASLTSFLIYAFTGKKGEKWKEIMSFRPAALALGLSIAFIEIGTIFIYKAGWTMNASFIVTNALITLCLILTGAVLYGEKLSRRQALGIVVSFIGICCIVW